MPVQNCVYLLHHVNEHLIVGVFDACGAPGNARHGAGGKFGAKAELASAVSICFR